MENEINEDAASRSHVSQFVNWSTASLGSRVAVKQCCPIILSRHCTSTCMGLPIMEQYHQEHISLLAHRNSSTQYLSNVRDKLWHISSVVNSSKPGNVAWLPTDCVISPYFICKYFLNASRRTFYTFLHTLCRMSGYFICWKTILAT